MLENTMTILGGLFILGLVFAFVAYKDAKRKERRVRRKRSCYDN